jgi:uncharacterized membrane protein YdjX (TVP38/TMEM64 family)
MLSSLKRRILSAFRELPVFNTLQEVFAMIGPGFGIAVLLLFASYGGLKNMQQGQEIEPQDIEYRKIMRPLLIFCIYWLSLTVVVLPVLSMGDIPLLQILSLPAGAFMGFYLHRSATRTERKEV